MARGGAKLTEAAEKAALEAGEGAVEAGAKEPGFFTKIFDKIRGKTDDAGKPDWDKMSPIEKTAHIRSEITAGRISERDGALLIKSIDPNASRAAPTAGGTMPNGSGIGAKALDIAEKKGIGGLAKMAGWGVSLGVVAPAALAMAVPKDFQMGVYITNAFGAVSDWVFGKNEKVGFHGERLVDSMYDDPRVAYQTLKDAGIEVPFDQKTGKFPEGALELALKDFVINGVPNSGFIQAPEIIEDYLRRALKIDAATPLDDAIATIDNRRTKEQTADANQAINQARTNMNLKAASGDLAGALGGNPSAADPAPGSTTISVSDALYGLKNFTSTVNIKVQFDGISKIVTESDANKDGVLSAEEAANARNKITADGKIPSEYKDGLNVMLTPS